MINIDAIPEIHWKTYIQFMDIIEKNKRNMYGHFYKNVNSVHDIINDQWYSVSDLNQIFYN